MCRTFGLSGSRRATLLGLSGMARPQYIYETVYSPFGSPEAGHGTNPSDDHPRIHPGGPARGPSAPAPPLRDPEERGAGRAGGDQVGRALLREPAVRLHLQRLQGAPQLRAVTGRAEGISQGTAGLPDDEELPADSLRRAAAGGPDPQDRQVPREEYG